MPPPSSENDLKRRARRRLIGAVALTLAAVIVLPLLLEDEPPPASQLDVRMPSAVTADAQTAAVTEKPAPAESAPAVESTPPQPQPAPQSGPEAERKAEPKPEPKAEPKPEPKAAPQPAAQPEPQPAAQPAARPAAGAYVVQLAALSDSTKAEALKARAALSGYPVFTDTVNNLTRVRVGPFESRQTADAAQAKLKAQGLDGQVVAK
jgi:DedD protein